MLEIVWIVEPIAVPDCRLQKNAIRRAAVYELPRFLETFREHPHFVDGRSPFGNERKHRKRNIGNAFVFYAHNVFGKLRLSTLVYWDNIENSQLAPLLSRRRQNAEKHGKNNERRL